MVEYILFFLMVFNICFTFFLFNKKNKKEYKHIASQLNNHSIYKKFYVNKNNKQKTQFSIRVEKKLNIAIVDNNAYWVINNVFYIADFINGKIINSTSRPIDINNMSKKELDKMLIILDNIVKEDNK